MSLSPGHSRQLVDKREYKDDSLIMEDKENDLIRSGLTFKRSIDDDQVWFTLSTRLIVVLASKAESRQTSKDLITLFSQILRKQPNLKRSSRSSRAGPTLFSSVLRRLTEQEGSRKNGGIDVAAVI